MVCYTDGSKLETAGSTGPYHRQRSATALPVKVLSLKRRTRNSFVADKPRDEFVQMQWRGWPPKTRSSPYVLQCRILSICVKRYRHKYRWTPNIGQRWNSALLWCDAELTARYTPLQACITTSNLTVLHQRVYAWIEGKPEIGMCWGVEEFGWPQEIRHSPNMCYPAECARSRSNGMGVIKEIRLKHLTPRILFSRSLRVIGTDTNQSAIYDFLSTFYSNHWPIDPCRLRSCN